ncbi:hypothetical protein ABG067_007252 [Albugo candida]
MAKHNGMVDVLKIIDTELQNKPYFEKQIFADVQSCTPHTNSMQRYSAELSLNITSQSIFLNGLQAPRQRLRSRSELAIVVAITRLLEKID